MSAPDLTTEVVGYRQWYVTPELELRPGNGAFKETWKPGVNTATCKRTDMGSGLIDPSRPDPCGDCPGEACECGFYALHDPSDHWYGNTSKRGLFTFAFTPDADPLLSGIVVAWGKLQVHHSGFRSEFARIAALAVPESKRDQVVARAVAAAYGVPLVPAEVLPKIAAEYGGTVPVEFRPEKPKPKNDDLWLLGSGHLGSLFGSGGLVSGSGYARGGLYQATWSTAPITSHFSYPAYPAQLVKPKLPTPWQIAAEDFLDEIGFEQITDAAKKPLKFGKQPANRQGPPKPRRAPKDLK